MAKQRLITPEQAEEIRTKDFFDLIAPPTIRFYSDYFITGDTYRCAWAVKEYPPSTDELAILSQLSDKSGVTLRIYSRLVDSQEQNKIVQNAMRKNKMKSASNDISDSVQAESNIQDVVALVANMRKNNECLLNCAVFIELKAASLDELKDLQSDISMELSRSKIGIDKLTLRQKEGFLSVMEDLS